MTIAKWDGRCVVCGTMYRKGDWIAFNSLAHPRHATAANAKHWGHADCVRLTAPTTVPSLWGRFLAWLR